MKRLLWAGIATLTAYLVFVGGSWWGIYAAPLRLFSIAVAGAALATWLFMAWRDEAWRPRSVLLPAILGCLGSLAISTVFSRSPRVSAEYLCYAVILAALYLLLVQLFRSPYFRSRLPVLGGLLFTVAAVAYLGGALRQWVDWWGLVGHLTIPPLRPRFEGLTYGNPSAALTVIALLAVPTAAHLGAPTRRGVSALIVIGGVVALVALVSGSRSGWLALAVTTLIVGAAWFVHHGPRQLAAAFRSGPSRAPALVVLGGVAVLLIAAISFAPSILLRVGSGGEDLRWTYAVTALRLFESSPIVGAGPGTWVIERIRNTIAPEPDIYVPHAHDVPVQTLGELGILGGLAGIVLIAVLAWLVRGGIADPDPTRRRWGWLTLAGLLYFGLHQLLDFYPNLPAVLVAAAFPVAYLDASATRRPLGGRLPSGIQRPWSVPAAGILATAAVFVALQEIPAMQHERAVGAANEGRWGAALDPARSAVATDSQIGSYQLVAGIAESRAGNSVVAAQLFEEIARTSDLPEAWLNLAAEQHRLGDREGALASIGSALRLGYQRPALAMPAGDLALRLGDQDLAAEAFASALVVAPSLAGDVWWQGDEARASSFRDSLRTAAASIGPGRSWELLLMAGDSPGAMELVQDNATLRDIVTAWDGEDAALRRVFDTCDATPLDAGLQLWCVRLASRAGLANEEQRYLALAVVVATDVPGIGRELRVGTPTPGPLPGSPADYWGIYTYRRATPWDILVPELVHLVSE